MLNFGLRAWLFCSYSLGLGLQTSAVQISMFSIKELRNFPVSNPGVWSIVYFEIKELFILILRLCIWLLIRFRFQGFSIISSYYDSNSIWSFHWTFFHNPMLVCDMSKNWSRHRSLITRHRSLIITHRNLTSVHRQLTSGTEVYPQAPKSVIFNVDKTQLIKFGWTQCKDFIIITRSQLVKIIKSNVVHIKNVGFGAWLKLRCLVK